MLTFLVYLLIAALVVYLLPAAFRVLVILLSLVGLIVLVICGAFAAVVDFLFSREDKDTK